MPGADVLHLVQPLLRTFRQDALHFGVRGFGEVHGGAPLAQYLRQRSDMIAVFVGNDDAVEPVDFTADCGKPPQRFFLAQPGIDQKPGPPGFDERAVARAA